MQPLFMSSDNMANVGYMYMIQDYFYHALYIQSLIDNWNYTINSWTSSTMLNLTPFHMYGACCCIC